MKPLKKATVRTQGSDFHPIFLAISGAAIGLSLWGYWRLAQETLAPDAAPKAVAGAPAPASAELQRARLALRRRFLDPLAHVRLAETLYREGRLTDAFGVLESAREFFGEARFAVAHTAVILENDPQAAETDPKGPAWAAGTPESFERQARTLTARAEFEAALKSVEAGLLIAPQHPRLIALKALVLSRFLDRPAQAVPLYRGLALGEPASPDGRLGVEFLGRRAHLAAIQKGPDGARSGDPSGTQAVETLEELARGHPDDPRVFQTLAMLRWTQGSLDRVREMTKTALARNPKHAGALSMAGALALSDKDADGAMKQLDLALQAEPGDLYSALKLAELRQFFKADPKAALPLWIAVHRLDPWREAQGRPVREFINETLAAQGAAFAHEANLERIERGFDSDDAGIRGQACMLAPGEGGVLVGRLSAALVDDVELVRRAAATSLAAVGKSTGPLLQAAAEGWLASDDSFLKARAFEVAAELFPRETRPKLLEALKSSDAYERLMARASLQRFYRADKAALAEALRSQSEEASDLVWALLSSAGLKRPGQAAPAPEPAMEPPPEPEPPPKTVKRSKPPSPAARAAALRKKGAAQLKAGALDAAAATFEKADALDAGNPDTLLGLARAYSRLRDASRGSIALRRCLGAAKAAGPRRLESALRMARHDDELTFLRAQPGFPILLKGFEP